jgi:ribosomal protein S18 acetylase RimI-like enzyme
VLIAFAEDHARELGLDAVTLYTNEAMTENLRLYPALGFVETGRRVEDGYRRVYFRKTVSGAEVDSAATAG